MEEDGIPCAVRPKRIPIQSVRIDRPDETATHSNRGKPGEGDLPWLPLSPSAEPQAVYEQRTGIEGKDASRIEAAPRRDVVVAFPNDLGYFQKGHEDRERTQKIGDLLVIRISTQNANRNDRDQSKHDKDDVRRAEQIGGEAFDVVFVIEKVVLKQHHVRNNSLEVPFAQLFIIETAPNNDKRFDGESLKSAILHFPFHFSFPPIAPRKP